MSSFLPQVQNRARKELNTKVMLLFTSLQMKHEIYTDPKNHTETNRFEQFILNLQANENGATENTK